MQFSQFHNSIRRPLNQPLFATRTCPVRSIRNYEPKSAALQHDGDARFSGAGPSTIPQDNSPLILAIFRDLQGNSSIVESSYIMESSYIYRLSYRTSEALEPLWIHTGHSPPPPRGSPLHRLVPVNHIIRECRRSRPRILAL